MFAHKAFIKTERHYALSRALCKKGLLISDVEQTESKMNGNVFTMHCLMKDGSTVTVFPKIKRTKVKALAVQEVGYQRKGANSQFYEDGMWDSPCVTSLKVLMEHWTKYFSNATPDSAGGWGSGVEFSMSDKERREYFKKNILDIFVEGEMFVQYH